MPQSKALTGCRLGTLLLLLLLFFRTTLISAAPRVITLSPANTELAFAAGITPVAVSAYSDYPSDAQKQEQVANWQGINTERIIALKPDVILAWRGGNTLRQVEQLAAFGSKIIWLDPQSITGVEDALRQLAPFSPTPEKALEAADNLARDFAELKRRYQGRPKKNVFLQFSHSPLFTANKLAIQNEITEVCGGRNIFADSPVPWPQVSREQVIARKPDVVIIPGNSANIRATEAFWNKLLPVPVIAVDEDTFTRNGPRILDAARQLCAEMDNLPARMKMPAGKKSDTE